MVHEPDNKDQRSFYDAAYGTAGFGAQRLFPNEELCRFMGRNFFPVAQETRGTVKILETGCGSGANLWMIAKQGFDAYGIDLSAEGIALCKAMLDHYETKATLNVGDMTQTGYAADYFDAVVDVFSSNCLTRNDGAHFLAEVARILKPGGKFFSYFPSKSSDTWTKPNHPDPDFKQRLDEDTLNGLHRIDGPFQGNNYAFRFLDPDGYDAMLEAAGLKTTHCELSGRTYRGREEYFEFLVIEASKP
ncbi:class I SAM-dependent methyltransferase [Pontivivens insulae]|uniref:Ubiquinone biosynthesis O-methyltransferase n=1 Tax=Pontivivens insulae TaxID=1639689 RepID=A0A2R8A7H4_9RHOB|nr:class I SAM-dependent methyltransferase [Pontivivens insulae]RED18283.1 ubiquinone/menaquinone biosynthesis C-methylase UbiE [Pontivivens insulae]SPF28181.1 Ubiquinone biosynthesis O-methyltransferase [Pontivivens insulae]